MRAGATYGYIEGLANSTDPELRPWSGSGGNPQLEPWRSNSLDLTYEKYFADGMGYWAVNGFYKDLRSYTFDEQTLSDFTGYSIGSAVTMPAIYQGYRTVPVNGSGGNVPASSRRAGNPSWSSQYPSSASPARATRSFARCRRRSRETLWCRTTYKLENR